MMLSPFLACLLLFLPVAITVVPQTSHAATTVSSGKEIALVPDRDIFYESDPNVGWKVIWDKGRAFSRQGRYDLALAEYSRLLTEKPMLDEARWEYGTILFHTGRLNEAAVQFNELVRHNPDSGKYLLAQAKIAYKTGDLKRAQRKYGQIYVQSPTGMEAIEALSGLIDALDAQGKDSVLLPLMEQLLLRTPDDRSLQKRIALLALDRDQKERAIELLEKLYREDASDLSLLKELARAHERLRNFDKACLFWQELAEKVPGDLEVHTALVSYYRKRGDVANEIYHLERLLQRNPSDHEKLLLIADLYLENGRTNLAVDYYSLYLDLFPEDSEALRKNEIALNTFALDLLDLVENSEARRLWQDLDKVTANRRAVYQQMAEILRNNKKYSELADVLLVIAEDDPEDAAIHDELTMLLESQGRLQELHNQ